MGHPISIKFHGVRAFYPVPSRHNQTTGGNTSCIEISDGKTSLFVNAGFGLATAGDQLIKHLKKHRMSANITLMFSDFLWDSTMGLPSFAPIHDPSTHLTVLTGGKMLAAVRGLDDVTSNLFTPFDGFKSLSAKIAIKEVSLAVPVGNWSISARHMTHRLTDDGATLWRVSHQSGQHIGVALLCDSSPPALAEAWFFFQGCETIVCAASTPKKGSVGDQTRTGFKDALAIAIAAKANTLILTQFHPTMCDLDLQDELRALQKAVHQLKMGGLAKGLVVRLATELCHISVDSTANAKIAV